MKSLYFWKFPQLQLFLGLILFKFLWHLASLCHTFQIKSIKSLKIVSKCITCTKLLKLCSYARGMFFKLYECKVEQKQKTKTKQNKQKQTQKQNKKQQKTTTATKNKQTKDKIKKKTKNQPTNKQTNKK